MLHDSLLKKKTLECGVESRPKKPPPSTRQYWEEAPVTASSGKKSREKGS